MLISMVNQLAKNYRVWAQRVYTHPHFRKRVRGILRDSMEILDLGLEHYEVVKTRQFILGAIVESYWKDVDRKQTSPFDLVTNHLEPWMIYLLPGRPATVIFAAFKYLEFSNAQDYKKMANNWRHSRLASHDNNFMDSRLALYNFTRPVRKLLGLELSEKKGWRYKKVPSEPRIEDLPSYIRDFLFAFATPSGILLEIGNFVKDKSIQQGISLVRALEELSSNLSSAETLDSIIEAIEEYNTTRTHLGSFEVSFTPLPEPDLSFLTDELWLVEHTHFNRNQSSHQQPMNKLQKKLSKLDPEEDDYEKKARHLRAENLYPMWKLLLRYQLIRNKDNDTRIELVYEMRVDHKYVVVISKTRKKTKKEQTNWRTDASFYRWFADRNQCRDWLERKIEEKKTSGYTLYH